MDDTGRAVVAMGGVAAMRARRAAAARREPRTALEVAEGEARRRHMPLAADESSESRRRDRWCRPGEVNGGFGPIGEEDGPWRSSERGRPRRAPTPRRALRRALGGLIPGEGEKGFCEEKGRWEVGIGMGPCSSSISIGSSVTISAAKYASSPLRRRNGSRRGISWPRRTDVVDTPLAAPFTALLRALHQGRSQRRGLRRSRSRRLRQRGRCAARATRQRRDHRTRPSGARHRP